MPRNEAKSKSFRKPLKELSNNGNGGRIFSKSVNAKKTLNEEQSDDGSLDRLLLVQSNLSSLLQQIDELVAQAFKVKETSKQGKKEIESFTRVLSDMLSTLKPWVPRFQKVISSPIEHENLLRQSLASTTICTVNENEDENCEFGSPEENTVDSLISPSPLVSWRANCTIQRGRQLFLLTPLPVSKKLSSKHHEPSNNKSVFQRVNLDHTVDLSQILALSGNGNGDLPEGVEIKPTPRKPSDSAVTATGNNLQSGFVSSPMVSKNDQSMLMTPCLKISPPKSCLLLDPVSQSYRKPNGRFRKSTPLPVRTQNLGDSDSSESSGSDTSEGLAFKYPELLGIRKKCNSVVVKKNLEASPNWLFSPPKSCVLLEPSDEKPLKNAATDETVGTTSSEVNLETNPSIVKEEENDVGSEFLHMEKFHLPECTGGDIGIMESTPLWKEPESTFRGGKRPGENTLKKELWTKFEAASTYAFRSNDSEVQTTSKKGFLDMLEEVSCDEEGSVVVYTR